MVKIKTMISFIQRTPIRGGGNCNNPIKGCETSASIDDYIPLLLIAVTILIMYFVRKQLTK